MGLFQRKDHRQKFIERLRDDYVHELRISEQIKQHAKNARYQHIREKLLSLAESEKKQASIIKEVLQNLGADVPEKIEPVTKPQDNNLFDALNRELETEYQEYFDYYHRIYEAEDSGLTDVCPILNRLREEEADHQETLLSILQRLNPYQI